VPRHTYFFGGFMIRYQLRLTPRVRHLLLAGSVALGISLITGASPARADFQTEITKVTTMSTTLQTVITGMTEAAIAPIGLAAAFGMFKMMILRAV
jgi:hypothetical protein